MSRSDQEAVPTGRRITLVLCLPDGTMLGALPAYDVASPWWPEVTDIVAGVRERWGIDVTVLRVLPTPEQRMPGGHVAYLAEVAAAPAIALLRWPGDPTAPAQHRASWAEPGRWADDLQWADEALVARGTPRTAPALQIRTWNLSSLWRLPFADGAAWLKVVPAFFAHEGAVLARLDPAVVPPVLAFDGPRTLLGHVPGEDQYGAPASVVRRMVALLVGLQVPWATRTDELLALGAPDWRPASFGPAAADVVTRHAGVLDGTSRRGLDTLLAGLDQRFADVAACGVPDTLVHGDFHPGNVVASGERLVILDWGDCGVGHPLLDEPACVAGLGPIDRAEVAAEWSLRWREAVPGCNPDRAVDLLRPVAALRQAIVYRGFLDRIERDEHPYHADDPATWLKRAVEVRDADAPSGPPGPSALS